MTRIGLFACAFRLPGADHQGALHEVLSAQAPQTRAAPPDRPFPDGGLNPAASRAGAFLDRVWDFDPGRFGLSDEDAAWMDPQQRLALELGAEVLERAGQPSGALGVFLGVSHDDFHELVRARLDRVPAPTSTITGCLRNLIGARVGWQLDRPGPAVVVDSACASSLVAIHLARRALEAGDCELALAGGVYLALTGTPFRVMSRAGALSPSGVCRPFDERADGLVMGEGGAVFLLAREPLAERLGRGPLAWIAGGALGGDGRTRAPVVPNPKAQIEVMRAAWADAGRSPADCDAVEAHGTGTRLGDLAEASSLSAVFPAGTPVGSVKSQLGHLMSAAGAAAVVKTLCGFTSGALYPSLGAERPVAALAGLRVPQDVEAFDGRLVGVSSFGFGGTNAHLVLERPDGPLSWGTAAPAGPRRHLPLPDRAPPRLTPGPLLTEHSVQGRPLWPGAASVELLMRGGEARALERLRWWRPITGAAELVREGDAVFVMEGERRSAEARVSEDLSVPPPPPWREDGEALAPEALYAALRALGMHHGPVYQRVRALRRGPGWAVAEVEGLTEPGLVLHPAALDAVFQAVAGLSEEASLRIPAGARRIVRLGELRGRLRVLTLGQPEDAAIWALDEAGQLVLYVEGLSLRAPPGARAFAPVWTPIDDVGEADPGVQRLEVAADDTAGLVLAIGSLRRALLDAPPGRVCVRASGRLAWALASWAWGLGQERPELSVTACVGDGPPPDVAGRLRWIDGRWCRLGLAPTSLDEAAELGDRVLILGGTGGIGRALARAWARPGRTLHLVGRRGAEPVEGEGTIVLHSTQLPEGLPALLDRVGPVDLIVHAAGVMSPGAARRQDEAATAATFGSKVGVAEALAEALGDKPTPVVLMSSSSAAREGQAAGLVDYAAANAALDALAERQRARGLPWTSVAWGAWRVGMAEGRAEALRGQRPLREAAGAWALPRTLSSAWVIVEGDEAPAAERAPARAQAPSAPASEAQRLALRARLRAAAAWVLGVPEAEIDEERSLIEQGLDSLGALDLLRKVEEPGEGLPPQLFFDQSSVVGLAELIAAHRAARAPEAAAAPAAAPPAAQTGPAPRGRTQRALQRLGLLDPSFVPFSALWLDLEGALDEHALRAAAAQVIQRHPMLRLRPGGEDEALHFDAERAPWIMPLPADDPLGPLRAPLPIERGPLVLRLLQSPAGPRLLLLVHHLVADGWSLQIIAQELITLLSGGSLPPLGPTSFADWTRWEAQAPRPPPAPALSAPSLPWEGPSEGPICARFSRLDAAATQRLKEEAAALGVTLAARVLAAWTAALGRWSGQAEVVVRIAEARRDAPLPGLESVVGCFADTTPLRLPARGGVEALSRAVHERLAARPPSRSSLDQPSLGAAPGFSFARFPTLGAPTGPLRVVAARGATATRATRLALAVWEHEGALGLSFTWPEGLLSEATLDALDASVVEGLTAWPVEVLDGEDAPAVLGDEPWGHRRLGRAVRALAAAFAEEGPVIAARLHQGPVALAALMAAQATGRAWMPLSPDDPPARTQAALDAVGAPRVYTEPSLRRLLGGPAPTTPEAPPKSPWAAILLTSGTTGAPRAAPIRRDALEAYLRFAQERFGYRADDRCLAAAPLSFDASLRQLLAPIRAGAAVLPAPPRLTRDPDALAEAILREGVTVWSSVPSLFRLVEARLIESRLRLVQLGGEALPADLARRWAGRARLFNLYGPTETTINATTYALPPDFDGDEVPLGEPWPGVRLRLVDPEGRDAEDGELLIGGVGLADEALGLSHARIDGEAWHRSGDRVVRVNGALFYRGRLDRQLKLRGQRVEAGEIEAALRQLPGVHEAVAVVIDDALWGVVEGTPPEDAAARLGERLPAAARPRLVVMSPLPRTSRGKVDEGAVRARLTARAAADAAPGSEGDWRARLLAAWTATLGAPPRSDDDDFFAAGGDSLAALRLFERLRPPPGLRPLTIYRCSRFGALLLAVTASAQEPAAQDAAPDAGPERLEGPVPPVVAGFLYAEALDPSRPAQWSARITLRGAYTDEQVQGAIQALLQRHATLRVKIVRGPRGLEWAEGPPPPIPAPRQLIGLRAAAQEAALQAEEAAELATPLDLSAAALRLGLYRLAEDELAILLLVHHLVADGWSLEVILDELDLLLRGQPLPPPPRLAPLTQPSPPLSDEARAYWAELLARPAPALPDPAGALSQAEARWPGRVSVVDLLSGLTRALGGPVEIGVAVSGRDGASARLVGPLASMVPVRIERAEDTTASLHAALAHAPGPGQLLRALPGLSPSRAIGAAVSVTVIEQAPREGLSLDRSALRPPAGCLVHVAARVIGDESRVTLWASEALGQPPAALLDALRPGPAAALITTLPQGLGPAWRAAQGDRPRVVGSARTALGESVVIALPLGADELERPGLEAQAQAALALAAKVGARAASLAGRLPTRLRFGAGLNSPLPLTTGHALTIYAVVETTLQAMSRAGLTPPLTVGVFGCGAIGLGALAALRRRARVDEVQLCDRPEAAARLSRLAETLAAEGVRVSLRAREALDAPLILAATSEGDAWPAEALPPGCVLIDDSFPPAVPVEDAWWRMDTRGDVLVLGGGLLTTAAPPILTPAADLRAAASALLPADPLGLPGCQWEALVFAARPGLPLITGPVTDAEAAAYAEAARSLGLVAAPLHLGARRLG